MHLCETETPPCGRSIDGTSIVRFNVPSDPLLSTTVDPGQPRRIKHRGPWQLHCTYTFSLFLHLDSFPLAFIHSFFLCSFPSSCSQATWKPPHCGSFLPALCVPRTVLPFLPGIGYSFQYEVFQVTSGYPVRSAFGFGTGRNSQLELPAGYFIDC